MLLAGGCANDANTLGGSFVFNVLNNQIMGVLGYRFRIINGSYFNCILYLWK